MAERPIEQERKHNLAITARAQARIEGVTQVNSFDETCVELSTVCGEMTVEGETLHVSTLDTERGIVVIDGRVDSVLYSERLPTKRGLRARWFG